MSNKEFIDYLEKVLGCKGYDECMSMFQKYNLDPNQSADTSKLIFKSDPRGSPMAHYVRIPDSGILRDDRAGNTIKEIDMRLKPGKFKFSFGLLEDDDDDLYFF